MRQLGVEPVYPPEEDIEVGDVFAIVSSDLDSPLANHAIRLYKIDLSKEVDSNYKNTYVFPKSFAKGPEEAADSARAVSGGSAPTDSVFTPIDHRSDLPIVTFPRFRLTDTRDAKFGVGGGFLGGLIGSAGANSRSETEVSITRTQTYGVPYLVAANALVQFCDGPFSFACTDEALRQILSTRVGAQIHEKVVDKAGRCRMRMDVELALINRVFLTRAIKTRLVQARNVEGQAAFNPVAKAPVAPAAASAERPETKTGRTGGPATESESSDESGSASEQSGLAVSFDGKLMERPVVFGFESARYVPEATPCSSTPNAVAGEKADAASK